MYIKGDAIINLAKNNDIQSYCRIKCMDFRKRVACVDMGKNDDLQKNDLINIQAYDAVKGLLLYEGLLDEITTYQAVISKLRLVNEKQRRNDVRVKVNIPLVLDEIHAGNKIKKMANTVILETMDISAGGLLLKTDLDGVEDDACFVFSFPLDTKSIGCEAKIVRKQAENGYFLYGCKFLNNQNDKTELRRFVFIKQIENRKISDISDGVYKCY